MLKLKVSDLIETDCLSKCLGHGSPTSGSGTAGRSVSHFVPARSVTVKNFSFINLLHSLYFFSLKDTPAMFRNNRSFRLRY